jgi:hypothetical protein
VHALLDGEPLSPELALVDPELAARARAALHTPDLEQRRPVDLPSTTPASTGRRKLVGFVVAAVLVPSLLFNVVVLRERLQTTPAASAPVASEPRSPVKATPAPPRPNRSAVLSARHEAQVPPVTARSVAPKTLRWPPGRHAVSYKVVVWRNRARVADISTTQRTLSAAQLRCALDARVAPPGRYLLFVYPVLRPTEPVKYGPLVKWGVLTVGSGVRCEAGG